MSEMDFEACYSVCFEKFFSLKYKNIVLFLDPDGERCT